MQKFFAILAAFTYSVFERVFSILTGYMSRQGMILNAFTVPNGALIYVNASFITSVAVTVSTNAAEAILTTGAVHGLSTGEYFEYTNNWSRSSGNIYRAKAASGSTVTAEGLDTTSTGAFPVGGGVGTIRRIPSWTQIQQILGTSSNGGEQQFTTFQPLESDAERRLPTNKSASGLTMTIGDDPTLAGYIIVSAANDDRLARGLRIDLPNGSKLLYGAILSLNKTPTLTVNEVMSVEMTASIVNSPVRYAT